MGLKLLWTSPLSFKKHIVKIKLNKERNHPPKEIMKSVNWDPFKIHNEEKSLKFKEDKIERFCFVFEGERVWNHMRWMKMWIDSYVDERFIT